MIEGSQLALSRFRRPGGAAGLVQRWLLIVIPLVGVWTVLDPLTYLGISIVREQYLGLFFGLALAAAFVTFPAFKSGPWDRVPLYDTGAALAGLAGGLYLMVEFPKLMFSGESNLAALILGVIAIGAVLEATRRILGLPLVLLVILFFLYARFSHLIPGLFGARGWSWERLIFFSYTDANSLLGLPLAVGATMVAAFVLFGEILFTTGGGKLFTDFALVTMGRFRGGPAKVSVVASSLFGTISGSAVANVAVDGIITIPMMKRAGYKPHVAAAVEAVASTGGQIMPPVMGVAAFVMADILGIPYAAVALAAVVPALLYYAALFIQIDLEAGKEGLKGLAPEEIPALGPILRMSWLVLVPLFVLVYTLFIIYLPPAKSALLAALAALGTALFQREVRQNLGNFLQVLENTGRVLLELTAILASAGFIIGVMTGTGLGAKLSLALAIMGEANVFLLLVMTAIVGLIMGMGMPTTAVYLLLAIFVAPALVKLGIVPLAAHLFIFYFGVISVITPPVAFATYTAAAIAGTDPMQTGWAGVRLGILGYIIPFLFVFSPALLLRGPSWEIALSVVTAVFGTWALGMALEGYFVRKLSFLQRLVVGMGGLGLLIPVGGGSDIAWVVNGIGAALALPLVFREWQKVATERALAVGATNPAQQD
ncbi:MAG: TRAP transporter fused permease subunit [Deltaproteobacteria bacterium]|nr:TRAP transporter fused permease subunit [Deltaproteobacteria bacterium]